jgi:isoleucyl-tRNA synthetase
MALYRESTNKSPRAEKEEKILSFWQENNVFEKTLKKDSPEGDFIFYEGPPTANGRPGIHHIEARSFKDAIPRYKTMRGFHVPRKAGWDTHGLPVELEVEKILGLKSKKEIENYGIEKFNEECKKNVWKYVDEWRDLSNRMGYWVDFDNAYVTYTNQYIETVWGIISEVNKRNLLYKDYKVLPWCPRCGTALSSHELAQGYQDVKDLSVYAKFRLLEEGVPSKVEGKDTSPSTSSGSTNTYLLAWTTTPWTLPGNVALAVGENIDYVKIKIFNDHFILAESRLGVIAEEHEVVKKMKGKDLVGLSYEPLYPYLINNLPNTDKDKLDKAYKVYSADFVNTEDGTGIVHTAVMYGQDDFVLGTKIGLPKYHLVDETGHFKKEVTDFAGRFVKDEETAVEIIKNLAHRGLLFKKEKHEHSYPHCWRCKTPLIYYARDSWYIRMSELRNDLIKENEKINWEPDYIKEGRFGEWLKEVKDWALSRERYWGTPLPAWESLSGKKLIIGNIEDLKKHVRTNKNKFIFVRHGEAESNINKICTSDINGEYKLTEKGKIEAKNAGEKIKKADAIYTSPYLRTQETAEIIADIIGFDKEKIKTDERLVEFNFGELNGKPFDSYLEYRKNNMTSYDVKIPGGESYVDARKRFGDFLYDIDSKHKGETILVVTHGVGIESAAIIIDRKDLRPSKRPSDLPLPSTGEMIEFEFSPLPHNQNYELDLHRPYIDEIVLEKDGETYTRVKEVMDAWLDSGSMPFAQDPENILYPADYIAEGIDQTRGWFYTLHAVGILMGRGRAYKNVISLGLILDKEGKKMSKSIGNVVNPWEIMDKYGIDVVRMWMYSVNQPGESKNFDERTLEEVNRRIFNLLDNVYTFYNLYRDGEVETNKEPKSKNPLDIWILSKQNQLTEYATDKIDNYKLLEPTRAIREFLDDLSTWYVRRSRERLKDGDLEAKATLYYVLKTLSKLIAPFAPFAAEDLYQKLRIDEDPISVHLEGWPENGKIHKDVLEKMERTRQIVSEALEKRSEANIKIRQPLSYLKVKLDGSYGELIKDEINVKEIIDGKDEEMFLETNLTPELIEEGKIRDIIRSIQEIRKEKGLNPKDVMEFKLPEEERNLYEKYSDEIQRATGVKYV